MSKRVHIFWAILGLVAAVTMSSCASTEEGVANEEDRRSEKKAPVSKGLFLAPTDKEVRTIQVYRTGNETSTPLIRLGSGETITVSFDMLTSNSRPLTAYFYHANRDWKRDLTPAEYLTTFQREDLLDYSISRVTDVAYTHYTYRFPTQGIDFRISGNYIVRITEQGMEDEVLFERPFFVSEQAMALNIRLDNVLIAGRGYTSIQPTVQFTPPTTHANAFDYGVCFVRNDRYQMARCSARTALAVLPDIAFYLEPEDSFQLTPASYFLDLSEIRVGGRIESTDLSIQPPVVAVAPDYARFPGTGLAPFLNGQTVVDAVVRNVVDPEVSAEYAQVFFRFVPLGEVRASGRVVLTGSFNNWVFDEENMMDWNAEEGWYEGAVLLKQGHYEYHYLFDDPRLQEAATGAPPQFRNLYTTFVYLADVLLQSDRLLSATGILTQ